MEAAKVRHHWPSRGPEARADGAKTDALMASLMYDFP